MAADDLDCLVIVLVSRWDAAVSLSRGTCPEESWVNAPWNHGPGIKPPPIGSTDWIVTFVTLFFMPAIEWRAHKALHRPPVAIISLGLSPITS